MKIGILTFHHGLNFGGFLQCYSILNILKTKGLDVSVINYINSRHRNLKRIQLIKNLVRLNTENFQKMRLYKKLQDEHLYLSPEKITSDPEKLNKFETILLGSDEVWNLENIMFGQDLVYFGVGLQYTRLVSYAASFGSFNAKSPMDSKVGERLVSLDYCTVRDANSKKIVDNFREDNAEIVLDPTLLNYNYFSSGKTRCSRESYALVYGSGIESTEQKIIMQDSQKYNYKIIGVGPNTDWCDSSYKVISPFEFLDLIRNSKFVITSMFHGTMFSIIFKKQFIAKVTPYRKNKFSSVVTTLCLKHRVVNDIDKHSMSILHEKEDYDGVFHSLDCEKRKSYQLLDEMISLN